MLRQKALAGLVLSTLVSCGGDGGGGHLSFPVDIEIDETTVPGFADPIPSCEFPAAGELAGDAFGQFTFDFKGEEEFEGRGPFEFEKVVLDDIRVHIVNEAPGDTDNFDFVDSIHIFAEDPNDPSDSREVAVLDPVPDGVRELVIPGTGVDVADLLANETFVGRVEATGRPPCDQVNFAGAADFDVTIF